MRFGYVRAATLSLLTGGFLTLGVLTSLHDGALAASSSTVAVATSNASNTDQQCLPLPVTASASPSPSPTASAPASESLPDGHQPRGRGYALAFPVGLVAADTPPPVLAIAVRFRLAF